MNAIGWLGSIEPDTSDRPIGALWNGADLVVLPLLKVDLWIVPKNGHPCDAVTLCVPPGEELSSLPTVAGYAAEMTSRLSQAVTCPVVLSASMRATFCLKWNVQGVEPRCRLLGLEADVQRLA